jgi:hypothetical protein
MARASASENPGQIWLRTDSRVSSASMLGMEQLHHAQVHFATAAETLFKQSITTEIHNRTRQSAEGLPISYKNKYTFLLDCIVGNGTFIKNLEKKIKFELTERGLITGRKKDKMIEEGKTESWNKSIYKPKRINEILMLIDFKGFYKLSSIKMSLITRCNNILAMGV